MRIPVMFAAVLAAGQATAQTEPAACFTQKTTQEMIECQQFWLAEAERELALAADDARAAFPKYAFNVDIAQENWFRYRDAQCHFMVAWDDGGTIAPVNALSCKIEETKRRTAELSGVPNR